MDAAIKPLIAANAADTSLHHEHLDTTKGSEGTFIDSMGTISGIAAEPEMEEGEFP